MKNIELRDFLAAHAMVGLQMTESAAKAKKAMIRDDDSNKARNGRYTSKILARIAYNIADDMLQAREGEMAGTLPVD